MNHALVQVLATLTPRSWQPQQEGPGDPAKVMFEPHRSPFGCPGVAVRKESHILPRDGPEGILKFPK